LYTIDTVVTAEVAMVVAMVVVRISEEVDKGTAVAVSRVGAAPDTRVVVVNRDGVAAEIAAETAAVREQMR
jgi:hypothetical protein